MAILEAMRLMGYDAVNIGENELGMGSEFLKKMAGIYKLPYISANVGFKDGKSFIQPYTIKKVDKVRIGITGIAADIFFKKKDFFKSGVVVKGFIKELKFVISELKKKTDLIILLSHLGYKGTVNLLKFNSIENIDIAVAGHGRKRLEQPEKVNGTILVQNSFGGELLGKLRITLDSNKKIKGCENKIISLTDKVPENHNALNIMNKYNEAIQKEEERLRRERHDKKSKQLINK